MSQGGIEMRKTQQGQVQQQQQQQKEQQEQQQGMHPTPIGLDLSTSVWEDKVHVVLLAEHWPKLDSSLLSLQTKQSFVGLCFLLSTVCSAHTKMHRCIELDLEEEGQQRHGVFMTCSLNWAVQMMHCQPCLAGMPCFVSLVNEHCDVHMRKHRRNDFSQMMPCVQWNKPRLVWLFAGHWSGNVQLLRWEWSCDPNQRLDQHHNDLWHEWFVTLPFFQMLMSHGSHEARKTQRQVKNNKKSHGAWQFDCTRPESLTDFVFQCWLDSLEFQCLAILQWNGAQTCAAMCQLAHFDWIPARISFWWNSTCSVWWASARPRFLFWSSEFWLKRLS